MAIITEEWLRAQNCVLGTALLEPKFVPRVVTELKRGDFTGRGLAIYDAMLEAFRESKPEDEVDPVIVSQKLGGTPEARQAVMDFMAYGSTPSNFERYMEQVRITSDLSAMQDIGRYIAEATTLEEARAESGKLADLMLERDNAKAYGPEDLIASYEERHSKEQPRLKWPISEMTQAIPARPGNLITIMAEPSGGKTAFALQCMWEWSVDHNVLFVSLETDKDTLFDTWTAFISGIHMDDIMGGPYSNENWYRWRSTKEEIRKRHFKILQDASMTPDVIKAAAAKYRADIVIVDYLQIVRLPYRTQSNFERVSEVIEQLHIIAADSGFIVIPLCQVNIRNPDQKGKPLTMHSAKDSGHIEEASDIMIALDLFVEKSLADDGIKANRVIRCVKNKRGTWFRIPAMFDGGHQTFKKSIIPNKDWGELKAARQAEESRKAEETARKAAEALPDMEQLPMDSYTPFD